MKYDGNKPIGLSELVESYPELVKEHADKVSKTDYATTTNAGVVKLGSGLTMSNGTLYTSPATSADIKAGSYQYPQITPAKQHEATFYGLAKASGDTTQASSSNAVGTYTDGAKSSIRSMLGAVGNTDVAGVGQLGLIKTVSETGSGLTITAAGNIYTYSAQADAVKAGSNSNQIIAPVNQHQATFYGLAKAAGADMASSSNAVGTYTDEAKAAIRAMLGAIGATDYASANAAGVVKISSSIGITSDGSIGIIPANALQIKDGATNNQAITPGRQHYAAYFGLAKAAGVDESGTQVFGTYSNEAKAAIQSMLGVEAGVSFVENVSGTTVTINGEPNVRYMCGEVLSISITPPSAGTIDVVFESGSTPAVLTVSTASGVTMKWPAWFDPTSLVTNTTYEINIMDGKYGSVMVW